MVPETMDQYELWDLWKRNFSIAIGFLKNISVTLYTELMSLNCPIKLSLTPPLFYTSQLILIYCLIFKTCFALFLVRRTELRAS